MKAAYSISCFSNDSDYYRAYVKWKSASYWTEVGWFALCVSETVTVSDNWIVFNVECLLYGIFVYKWPHLFIVT